MRKKHISYSIVIIIILMFITVNLKSQVILINHTFAKDTVLFPFSSSDSINSFKISGSVKLYGDNSLIRVILIDDLSNEYLAYEAYQLISVSDSFAISNICYETCLLNLAIPYKIKNR